MHICPFPLLWPWSLVYLRHVQPSFRFESTGDFSEIVKIFHFKTRLKICKSIRKKLGKYQRILLYSYTISNLPCNKKSAKSLKIQCLKKHMLKNLLNTFKKYIKYNPCCPKLLLPFQIKIICVNSRGSNPSYLKTLSIYLSLHVVWHKYEKQILNNNFFSYNSFSSS